MIPYSATQGIRRFCFAAVLALLGLVTGCDRYLINICNFRDELPGCREDGGDASAVDLLTRGADSPLGPLRKFEWRAKITNDANQKFVGILQKEYAITLLTTPAVSFSAVQFHLERPRDQMQLEQVACPKCPLPTNIKPNDDSVYLTNEAAPAFWLLRNVMGADDESYSIKANGDLTKIDTNLNLATSRRPFFHPTLDASLIPTRSVSGWSPDRLRLTAGATVFVSTQTEIGTITAALIGDIDATDPVTNGIEVVRFAGATVRSVYHYDPVVQKQSLDAELQRSLNDEINVRIVSAYENIGAAYINDLNRDGFLDFVFSLGVNVFVSSYKRKSANSGLPVFESWPEKVLNILSDENIQSIMAIDLTNDGYPELIIVTNKFVHFYLNTP